MSSSTMQLSNFLSDAKENFLRFVASGEASAQDWTIVMGNEAGDLDSIASAIAYAWYSSTIQSIPATPLLQTPRQDLHLRAENLHAFALAGIDPASLLCISDVPKSNPQRFPATKFALVDHNHLGAPFTQDNPDARVVAVIDHHADEGLYRDTADPRIIVEGIGSCTSLVAQFLEEKCAEHVPSELATLLLSAIVVDTGGVVPGGKAVETDYLAAAFLASRCTLNTAQEFSALTSRSKPRVYQSAAIQELNQTLQAKKASVFHLSTHDLLRRDYKEYALTPTWAPERAILVGLSTVPLGLSPWLHRDSVSAVGGSGKSVFAKEAEEWMDTRGLAALGILTSFRKMPKPGRGGRGGHRREIMLIVRRRGNVDATESGELFGRLVLGLETNELLNLKTKNWEKLGVQEPAALGFGEGVHVRVWKQRNANATRKAIAPLVKAIVEGDGDSSGNGAARM